MTSIIIDRTDGLSSSVAIKGPCRVATTANITLSGQQTIDGVAVVTDDRVLVKDQTTASENGIYVVDTGPWRRAKDFSNSTDVKTGTSVFVTSGSISEAKTYYVSTTGDISIGTTSIAFVRQQAGVPVYATTRTALKALDTTKDTTAILTESGREGVFVWKSGNYATQITADTAEAIYVKATAIASSAGSWVRKSGWAVSGALARWAGATDGSGADSAAAITALLGVVGHVVIDGDFRCDAMISLEAGKTLELKPGGWLRRLSASSAVADPVVWVKGTGASIIGYGQYACGITTQNRSAKGVVRLGHADMTASHATVAYCTLRDFNIAGSTAGGQTSGSPDICLYMPNPQFSSLVSYFHNVTGLYVQNANFGIYLHGWANANTISAIQGASIGNTTLGVNTNAFIYCHGALDNVITGCFLHSSVDSIGLLVNTFDNTGAGGSLHQSTHNSFTDLVFEQGGGSALGLKSIAGEYNKFEIRDNCAGGNTLHTDFYKNNSAQFASGQNGVTVGTGQYYTLNGVGTRTVKVNFATALTGAAWRNAIVKFVFHGVTGGFAAEEYAEYAVPITGLATWAIGTPTKIFGTALTITQTAATSTSVSFTVAGSDVTQNVSILLSGTGSNSLTFG